MTTMYVESAVRVFLKVQDGTEKAFLEALGRLTHGG
jgi:hypothetical protein